MIEQLLTAALETLHSGRTPVLISIVRSSGSTPRKIGACMLADHNGLLCGTIGGGLLEHRCLQLAATAPAVPRCEQFVLDNRQAGSLGMVCGGTADVLFTPLTDPLPLRQLLQLHHSGTDACLALPLHGGAPFCRQDAVLPGRTVLASLCGQECLLLPLRQSERVYLFGGGHVSCALAELLHRLDFRCLVVDDRTAFCSPDRFPHAEHTVITSYEQLDQVLTGPLAPTDSDALCIMTRGHEGDTHAIRFALRTPASYIGLMGSRRKRDALFARLKEEGFPQASSRIITPIGLAIGAETPEEIAVSIAAQLIAWRASEIPFKDIFSAFEKK